MAQPFYSSGESIRVMHGLVPCTNVTNPLVMFNSFIHSDFSSRQVISSISDYRFGIAATHTYPSMIGKSSCSYEGPTLFTRIHFDEYLISSSHHKPFET